MNNIFHGGNLSAAIAQYGGSTEDWLDLSTGINPNSWPIGQIEQSAWTRLPGASEEQKLLAAAREYYGVGAASDIYCANGTQAIIQLLPQLFEKKCRAEIVQPTYEEHRHCWQQSGHEVVLISNVEAIGSPDIAVVVNPNNPDGRMVERSELLALAQRLEDSGGVLIVDEAFGDVFPQLSIAGCGMGNVIVLKSFGKFFGLAGARLGFAIGSGKTIGELKKRSGPWAVSGPALEIGVKALNDKCWIAEMRDWILKISIKQSEILTKCGLELAGNGGLFLQTKHHRSADIFEQLAARHILVRKFPARADYLRFGLCADNEQMIRLTSNLEEVVNG